MDLSSGARTTRAYSPISGPLQHVTEWQDALQDGATQAGGILETERQPAGALILAYGVAVVEMVPPERPPEDVRGPFDFGATVGSPPREPRVVTRYRIGPGDHLEIAGGGRHPDAGVARVHASADCEWVFVPVVPPGGGAPAPDPSGRHPVLGALADRRFLHRQDLVGRLHCFPLLAGLSYDAVRYMASFFRMARYVPGEVLFAKDQKARPTLVLSGVIEGPGGIHGPGSTLFPDDLTWDGDVSPSHAPDDFVARSRTVTAEMPTGLAPTLASHDIRSAMRWDPRRQWPWVVMLGHGVDEAAPDAQTLAFNLAAREGADLHPAAGSDVATPVLLIDADHLSLEHRAPVELLSKIDVEPDWSTWAGPEQAFGSKVATGVVGLRYSDYGSVADVESLIGKVDKWLKGQDVFRKVLFRLPRDAGPIWEPLMAWAIRIQVTTDDLVDPLPRIVPPLADVLRIVRPLPDQPFRIVSRAPYFALPRTPGPTREFWQTGVPWIYTQE